MRDRADSALEVSRENVASLEYAAAMRGKARGYRECADMLESLIRNNEIHRKFGVPRVVELEETNDDSN